LPEWIKGYHDKNFPIVCFISNQNIKYQISKSKKYLICFAWYVILRAKHIFISGTAAGLHVIGTSLSLQYHIQEIHAFIPLF
jgi:hypothetical protein